MNETQAGDWLLRVLDHPNVIPIAGMVVGAVAIAAGATVTVVLAKLWLTHRQRIAMIARGMHPDAAYMEIADEPTSPPGSTEQHA